MKFVKILPWLTFAVGSSAQFSNWKANQISTSICVWYQPRAAIIRDVVYLDGGSIWWSPGMDDGTIEAAINHGNYQGTVMTYNLSFPFTKGTNTTGLLLQGSMSKARGGLGNANGASPNYYDGSILSNNYELFFYGGAEFQNDGLYSTPIADEVLGYQAFQYGPTKQLWQKGFLDGKLSSGVNQYVSYGGAANAPSEDKAWYFSGLTSPTSGPLYANTGVNDSTFASRVSNTMITLDMKIQLKETWKNSTLPNSVKGRANPELVWVPVGAEGMLMVLGGATYPEWADKSHKSSNETASKQESPVFMQTVDIYDIANDKWYKQPTENSPGTRARGCAVVAPSSDYSSINVYYYGGFDGVHAEDDFYDDVWVLSLPSFTWIQLNKGVTKHGRAGHKCFLPYPDQMMVFGGYTPLSGNNLTCLEGGPVVIFNLTSGLWLDAYDPAKYSAYGVHEKVHAVIGGDAHGNATMTAPVPSGWATPALKDVFAVKYNATKITPYWPYQSAMSNSSSGTGTDGSHPRVPSWIAPLLGSVLGVAVVTGAIIAYCICRGKIVFRSTSTTSDSIKTEAAMRILSWVKGEHLSKQLTRTESSIMNPKSPRSPQSLQESGSMAHYEELSSPATAKYHEIGDTQILELGDTSSRLELHDTGLSPIEVAMRRGDISPAKESLLSYPSMSSISEVMRFQRSQSTGDASLMTDSPTLCTTPPTVATYFSSCSTRPQAAVSERPQVSPQQRSPLSVISPLAGAHGDECGDSPTLPLSPPSACDQGGGDYLLGKASVARERDGNG